MQTRLRAAVLALLSVLVLALVACGEEGGGADTQDPRALLEKAFSKPVDSGHVLVDVALDLDGVQGMEGPISFSLRGPSSPAARTSSRRRTGTWPRRSRA
jgi:hypothetical protein